VDAVRSDDVDGTVVDTSARDAPQAEAALVDRRSRRRLSGAGGDRLRDVAARTIFFVPPFAAFAAQAPVPTSVSAPFAGLPRADDTTSRPALVRSVVPQSGTRHVCDPPYTQSRRPGGLRR